MSSLDAHASKNYGKIISEKEKKPRSKQDSMMIITSIKNIMGFSSKIPVMTILLYVLEDDHVKKFKNIHKIIAFD